MLEGAPYAYCTGILSRVQAPEAEAEAAVAQPGKIRSPGSPNRPRRFASPEVAEAVAQLLQPAAEAEAVQLPHRSGRERRT